MRFPASMRRSMRFLVFSNWFESVAAKSGGKDAEDAKVSQRTQKNSQKKI